MMLVRSNLLPHSGCYGTPANCRFHAQVRMRTGGVPPAGDSLGYISVAGTDTAFIVIMAGGFHKIDEFGP